MIPLMLAKQGLSLGLGMVQVWVVSMSFPLQTPGSVLASKVIIAAVVHFVPPMVRSGCSCGCCMIVGCVAGWL